MTAVPTKRFGELFEAILVGAARRSSAELGQYKAYCTFVGKFPYIDDFCAPTCYFGIDLTQFLGMGSVSFFDWAWALI